MSCSISRKTGFVLLAWLLAASPCSAAYALVAHKTATGTMTATTTATNTTGANLYVIGVSEFPGGTQGTLSDSQSNSYSKCGATSTDGGLNVRVTIYYVQAPTTNASTTWQVTSPSNIFTVITASAWSGSSASPCDQTNNGLVTPGTSFSMISSTTPSAANELVVTVVTTGGGSALTGPGGSYTTLDTVNFSSGANMGGAIAYWIQTTATATQPGWSWTTSTNGIGNLATFRSTAAPAAKPCTIATLGAGGC